VLPDPVPAGQVRRLTYTRAQAAEALGVSVQTLDRRVVPAIATVKTTWGSRLIPVSELERYLADYTEPARSPRAGTKRLGRPAAVPSDVARRIEHEHELGKSLGQIARDLNAAGVPTAQGGRQWWPSTVRSILSLQSA
jgi:recombinase